MSVPYPVTDLAAYLTGRWSLHREIREPDGTPLGEFTGLATFTRRADTLDYAEDGTLSTGTYSGPAHRALRYHLTGPGRADVYFDYGVFFHDLDLREGTWRTDHPCRADLYRGEFRTGDADTWHQTWVVAGPTKNHTLSTSYRRVRQSSP